MVKDAVAYYEIESGTTFQWSHHPDYISASGQQRQSASSMDTNNKYFDVNYDTDATCEISSTESSDTSSDSDHDFKVKYY